VLVDFWAPWCAPCRALSPVLDRLADELADRFTLAKLNTEEEPQLAAHFGVRGIPNCKLFVDGEVVDEFTGALPERAIRDFLARALPSRSASLVAEAKALLATDSLEALRLLDEAAALDADDEDVLLTRTEALLELGRAPDANALIEKLATMDAERVRPLRDERRFAVLKARTALATATKPDADLALLARSAGAPGADAAARLAYALSLATRGEHERALDVLLGIVRTDRKFGDDVARRTMLTIFEALPADSDLTRRYRRELAAALN